MTHPQRGLTSQVLDELGENVFDTAGSRQDHWVGKLPQDVDWFLKAEDPPIPSKPVSARHSDLLTVESSCELQRAGHE